MINLTINGQTVTVENGTTVLEAALAHGIDVPRLCYHPDLKPSGGCRLCLVAVQGRPNPVASCGLMCEEGMTVDTHTPDIEAMRKNTLDLFVSDHPLRCVTCDKAGACDLQKYAYQYGLSETSYAFNLSRTLHQDDNPFFIRDHQYCILCGKCARVCDEVVGANAIEYAGRGFTSHIATPFDGPMINSDCVFCGSCVQVCPTAALLPVSRLHQGREWELKRERSVCGYCGVGCSLEYALNKNNQIVYAQGYPEAPVNGEFLCSKGRYGWDFAASPERLTTPLIRRSFAAAHGIAVPPGEGEFAPLDWESALTLAAQNLADTAKNFGGNAVAGLASARCTNEDNYVLQKLFRATLNTNNIDHCARLCHASSVTGLGMALGSGAMTNPIRDIRHADCIFITGSNTAESHPVIGYEVVRATQAGANLLIVDPRRIPLVEHATLWLQTKPGTDQFVFMAMAHVILREGWADTAFIQTRTENFEAFAASVQAITPEVAALESGVKAEDIIKAARMYALGERAHGMSKYAGRGHATILYAMGITQRRNGTDLVLTLANLAMLTGQIGKPSTGINPLRGQSNVQGSCDVGCLPNVLPGYQPVTDEAKRRAVAQKWGLADLPSQPGLTVVELMHAIAHGEVRALYVMGENPMLSDPDINHVEEALKAIPFLVVQDIFLTETAQLAHLVLPAAAALEKDGTKTNTERRVQLIHPVTSAPGQSQTDWWIVCEIAKRAEEHLYGGPRGVNYTFRNTAEIMAELATVAPIYGGILHHRLTNGGLAWPCPTTNHPGTPILHTTQFTRGLGKFHAVEPLKSAEQPDAEYPLVLSTGRVLYHYHTGTMTRKSAPLAWAEPGGYVEMNDTDASRLNVTNGETVTVRSRRGAVTAQARVDNSVPTGVVFMAFHWVESPANRLTHDFALDPVAKIPEFKVCAVTVEKN